ncbi:tetratricopeptide repeat protein [Sphingomonas sp. Leaf62]|uniref:tetratricopeptide repeat protein n=1 Tax=Sphingomonas sp. Leaf62 TaxID=1736228 RepID=UPI0006F82651|nr:tetratricopeptide repeat protein [Sphingomonas sp. Leaf62]KQN73015.1 hypothetical protein ASE91_18390 [Sphingomonas sp. Leaf62]
MDPIDTLLTDAQARRDAGDWPAAAALFARAAEARPADAAIWQNLALARYAAGERRGATEAAARAVAIQPTLWQARALLARVARDGGQPVEAERQWQAVLAHDPASAPALMGLADLHLNVFGDAARAAALAGRVAQDPDWASDAELTRLMAALYTGALAPVALSEGLRTFARTHLQRPAAPVRVLRSGRRRVGLISPLLSASPVYFLTFSTWAALAATHDLVIFQRGTRDDAATAQFRALAGEWHDVAHVPPEALTDRLVAAELDVVFDLGGWSDVGALSALSARPAARAFTWIGGQSATTGLDAFDGWIGDKWQSPATSRALYAEPLVEIDRGYCDYTPPAAIARLRDLPKQGVALVGNPVKVTDALRPLWPEDVREVTLIDRRYAYGATLERVRRVLEPIGVSIAAVVTPDGHDAYLAAVARHRAIVNTAPYAAGLTAVEAYHLGVRVIGPPSGGPLFAQRHVLSHARTRGRNPTLARQIAALIAQPA